MWLTLLALRNRIGILMLSLAMVVLGVTSLQRLPVDLFPNIQVPVAFVGVIYKGAPPLDIEQSVVYPIEKAVSSASNVEHVESFAKQGIGAVQVWFNGFNDTTQTPAECYRTSMRRYKGKGFHEAGEFTRASLPDLLQELIDTGVSIQAVPIYKGWMEVDSFEEYQKAWARIRS